MNFNFYIECLTFNIEGGKNEKNMYRISIFSSCFLRYCTELV